MTDLLFPDADFAYNSRSASGALRLRWEPLAQRKSTALAAAYGHSSTLHVDLSRFEIVSADGLVWLLALMHHRHQHKAGDTYISLPLGERALLSVIETRFIDHLIPLGVRITNEFILYSSISALMESRAGLRFSLHRIQPISHSTVHPVISSLQKELTPTLEALQQRRLSDQTRNELLPIFVETLSEFLLNIVRHVKAAGTEESLGYACYRPWPKSYPLLRFVCSDLGDGFMHSLKKKKIGTAWEGEALLEGLLYRFFNPEEQVLGLYQALEFVALLHGRLFIRSRDARLSIKLDNEPTVKLFRQGYANPTTQWLRKVAHVWRCDSDIPGTHIVIDLSLT